MFWLIVFLVVLLAILGNTTRNREHLSRIVKLREDELIRERNKKYADDSEKRLNQGQIIISETPRGVGILRRDPETGGLRIIREEAVTWQERKQEMLHQGETLVQYSLEYSVATIERLNAETGKVEIRVEALE
ncbi:MAG: hypothetical protein LUO93_08720 [Methanomicrobiales archaeon]|nr:hypothetical protein [Methanomicrobiales archaeon]